MINNSKTLGFIIRSGFETIPYSTTSFPAPLREKVVEILNLNAFNPVQLISRLLEKNPGVFLGDLHGNHNIPEFIINSMPELKQKGLNKFFMENDSC